MIGSCAIDVQIACSTFGTYVRIASGRARAPFFFSDFRFFFKLHRMSKRYRATGTARPTHDPRVANRPTRAASARRSATLLKLQLEA